MIIRKCDLCGEIYDDLNSGKELVAHVSVWNGPETDDDSIERVYEQFDCCPRCTYSISKFMQVLKQGDDYNLTVFARAEE